MNYLFGKTKPGRNACRLKALQGIEDDFELFKGISLASRWSSDASFYMNENFPEDLKLEEVVFNRNNLLVVSERLKELLEAEQIKHIEFLPVRIFNHKKRQVKENYFILNQTLLVDCLDLDKSTVRYNNIDPSSISSVVEMVIEEDKIPENMQLFRMARCTAITIFARELAKKLEAAAISGITFGEISDWEGK